MQLPVHVHNMVLNILLLIGTTVVAACFEDTRNKVEY